MSLQLVNDGVVDSRTIGRQRIKPPGLVSCYTDFLDLVGVACCGQEDPMNLTPASACSVLTLMTAIM